MDTTSLLIVNIVLSAVTPLIIAVSHFVTHIRRSQCCGATVEVDPSVSKPPPVKHHQPPATQK